MSQYYQTADLSLAAVLRMNEIRPMRMEALGENNITGQPIVCWVYHNTAELQAIVDEYKQSEISVEPVAFMRAVKKVRDSLYEFTRKQRRGDSR